MGDTRSPVSQPRVPAYRLHKASGLAVVRLSGREFYLGRHGSPESHRAYDRAVAEWMASGRAVPPASPRQPTRCGPRCR